MPINRPRSPKGIGGGKSGPRGRRPGFEPNYSPEQIRRYKSQDARFQKALDLLPDAAYKNGAALDDGDLAAIRAGEWEADSVYEFRYRSDRAPVGYWTVVISTTPDTPPPDPTTPMPDWNDPPVNGAIFPAPLCNPINPGGDGTTVIGIQWRRRIYTVLSEFFTTSDYPDISLAQLGTSLTGEFILLYETGFSSNLVQYYDGNRMPTFSESSSTPMRIAHGGYWGVIVDQSERFTVGPVPGTPPSYPPTPCNLALPPFSVPPLPGPLPPPPGQTDPNWFDPNFGDAVNYPPDGGGGSGGSGSGGKPQPSSPACNCPDFSKKQGLILSSPYLSEQSDRDWSSSKAGAVENCKHTYATRIYCALPYTVPVDPP